MVSSTMRDLANERSAARSSIIAAGMRPWMAEEPPGELLGLSPEKFCQRMAQECDLYVLILGPHYGFVPSEQPSGDIFSITQLEYHWARDTNRRKILVFIHADALATQDHRQKAFIQEAQDFAHGYLRPQPFTSPEHLGALVSDALSEWQRAEMRGAMSYLRHTLSRLETYHDPIIKEREHIRETVPVYARLHNPDDDFARDLDAPLVLAPGDDTLDLVARTLEDFFDDTVDVHMLRNAAAAHRNALVGGLGSLLSALDRTVRELAGTSDDAVDLTRGQADAKVGVNPTVVDAPIPLLREFRHLFVVGDPGAGKSILVQRVACEIASEALEATELLTQPLPVYMTAAELNRLLRERAAGSVEELIEEMSAGIAGADLALAIAYGRGNLVLLIDGLDEVLDDSERHAIVAYLRQIGASQQILITMRPSILRGLRLDMWRLGSLEPLSAAVRLSLVQHVLDRLARPGEASRDLSQFERALNQRTDIRAWIGNPLLLKLVVLEYDRTGQLPSSRAELYQRAFERLVDVEDRQQPLVQEMTRLETVSLLTRLALQMMLNRQTLVSHEEIAQHTSTAGTPLSEPKTTELLTRASILQPRSGDKWGFIHQVFMDYAAAAELSQWPSTSMRQFVVLRRLSARWEHVTRLLVGELDLRGRSPDADSLIQALIDADDSPISALKGQDPLHLSLLRAAQCQRDRSTLLAARGTASTLKDRWQRLWRASFRESARAQAIALDALGPEAVPEIRRELARRFRRHRWTIQMLRKLLWSVLWILPFVAGALALILAQFSDRFISSMPHDMTTLASTLAPVILSVMAIGSAARSLRKPSGPRASTLTTGKAMRVVSRYWPGSSDIVVDLTKYLFERVRRWTRVITHVVRIINWVTPRWIKRRDPLTWDKVEVAARYGPGAVQALALLDDYTRWLVGRFADMARQDLPPSLAQGIRSQSTLLRPLAIYLAGVAGEAARPVVNDIEAALQSPDEMSRLAAIAALTKIAPDSASVQQTLARALGDEAGALTNGGVSARLLETAADGPYRIFSDLLRELDVAGDSKKVAHNRLTRALLAAVSASPSPPDKLVQRFTPLLRSNDSSTRIAAIIASRRVRPLPKALVDALLAATADADADVADAAFEALESAQPLDPEVLQSMHAHLLSGIPARQARALGVIGALDERAFEELHTVIKVMGSESEMVRAAALSVLLSHAASTAPVMADVRELLLTGEKETRLRVMSTVASVAQSEIKWRDIAPLVSDILGWLPDLIEELPETGRYWFSTEDAGWLEDLPTLNPASWRLINPSGVALPASLRRIVARLHQNWAGLDAAVEILAQILSDPDGDIAEAATAALLALGPFASPAAGKLHELVTSSTPEVVERAVRILSLTGLATRLSAEQLCELLRREHTSTRVFAARSLARLGEAALPALPYLKQIVTDASDQELRVQAILAIGAMGSVVAEVLPLLTPLLNADEPAIRHASITAVGAIGRGMQETTDVLVAQLQHIRGNDVSSVLDALRGAGPTLDRHVGRLRALLRITSPATRQRVLNLLSSEVSFDVQRLTDYSWALGDKDAQVREAALRALTKVRKASSGMTQQMLLWALRVAKAPLGPILIFLEVIVQVVKWGVLLILLACQVTVLFPQARPAFVSSVPVLASSGLLMPNYQPFTVFVYWTLFVAVLYWLTVGLVLIRRAGLVSAIVSNVASNVLGRPRSTRTTGLEMLSHMGPDAVSVLPRIAPMLRDPSRAVRDSAAASLQDILRSLDEV